MLILLTGGAKNGKSHWAETALADCAGRKLYLATMEPYGEEAHRAIARHRKMREGKGFETVEKSRNLEQLSIPEGCSILIECMSTLCANELFSPDGALREDPAERIADAVRQIAEKTERTVVVTNDVGSDGICYEAGTAAYIRSLGRLNQKLAQLADTVIECVYGIPVLLKGEFPWDIQAEQ